MKFVLPWAYLPPTCIRWTPCWKKLFSRWIPQSLKKKGSCRLVHRNVGKSTIAVLQKTSIRSSQMTNLYANESETVHHVGQLQRKLFVKKALRNLFIRPKRRIHGSTAEQLWLGTQWLLFISAHQENIAWYTIFAKHQFLLN